MSIQSLNFYQPPLPNARPAVQYDKIQALYETIAGTQQYLSHFNLQETHWRLLSKHCVNPHLDTPTDDPGIVNLLKSIARVTELIDQTAFSSNPIDKKRCFLLLSKFSKELWDRSFKQLSLIEAVFVSCVSRGKIESVKFLATEGPDLLKCTNTDGHNMFHIAAAQGQLIILKDLLERKPDFLFSTNSYGETAAHTAAKHGQRPTLNFLATKAPYLLHIRTSRDANPFHYAAAFGQIETLQYLLGIDSSFLFSIDEWGFNACYYAAGGGHLDILKYLLSKNPLFLHYMNIEGLNLFLFAIIHGQQEVLEFLLLQRPAFLYITDKSGFNPVYYATKYEKPEILKFLLKTFASKTPAFNTLSLSTERFFSP